MKLLFQPTDDLSLRLGVFKREQEEQYEMGRRKFYKNFYELNGGKLSGGWFSPSVNLPKPDTDFKHIDEFISDIPEVRQWWSEYCDKYLSEVEDTLRYLESVIPIVNVALNLGSPLILTIEDATIFSNLLNRELIKNPE